MKICCFGDIHYYGLRRDLEKFTRNVENLCLDSNIIVIVGDISSSGKLEHVEEVLSTVKEIVNPTPLLVIPGNHDIYLSEHERASDISSLLKLSMFNELVERLGCIALMKRPFILRDTAFVGSMGWYDYSFAPEWLGLSIDDFRDKSFGLYTWADRDYVKLPFSDEEFTLYLLNKFEEDIKRIYDKVDKIVVVMHHIPFRKLVEYKLRPEWDYFSTFMGSENFGYMIKKYGDKVKLVVYGHSHNGVNTGICREVDSIKTCNCASPIPLVIEI